MIETLIVSDGLIKKIEKLWRHPDPTFNIAPIILAWIKTTVMAFDENIEPKRMVRRTLFEDRPEYYRTVFSRYIAPLVLEEDLINFLVIFYRDYTNDSPSFRKLTVNILKNPEFREYLRKIKDETQAYQKCLDLWQK